MSPKKNELPDVVKPAYPAGKLDYLNIISKSFWLFFDNMGLFLGASILWFFLSLPVITCPAATAAIIFLADEISFNREVNIKDFFKAFKNYFFISTAVAIFMWFVIILALAGFSFYSSRFGIAGKLIAVTMGIMVFVNCMGMVYILPLSFRVKGVFRVMKDAITLAVCHPLFTFGVLFYLGVLFVVGVISGAGILLVTPALSAAVISRAVRELSYRYGFSPASIEEPRTLKGVFMPWKE